MTSVTVAERPPRLVLRFALYSALALLLAGGGMLWFVEREARQRAEAGLAEHANHIALELGAELTSADLERPANGERLTKLEGLVRDEIDDDIARVNVWNREGTLVYSDAESLIGARSAEQQDILEALAGGQSLEVTNLPGETAGGEGLKVLEATVPLRVAGSRDIVAAVEVSEDYAALTAEIAKTAKPIAFALVLALLLLYAALFPILHQVTKALDNRSRRLSEQTEALRETLSAREETERRLREAEASYRALVEQLPLVTYMDELNESSSSIYISPQIEAILGYSVDEWLGDPEMFPKLLHPADRQRVLEEHRRSFAAGMPFSSEYRLIARDGREVWFADEIQVVRDADGRPQHAQGFLIDITERKRAEEALQGSEERFRTLVSNVPGIVFRCEVDADWTMQFMSDAIEDLSGYPASDFIGNAVRTFTSIIHPDDVEPLARAVDEAVAERRPYDVEYRIFRSDGETRWVHEYGQGIIGADGHLWLDGAIFDITETKGAAERIRDAERRYRTLVEQLPLAMYMRPLDMDDANIFVSEQVEAMLGYPAEMWRSDPDVVRKVVHPDDVDLVIEGGRRVRETGEPFRAEYRCIAEDGRLVWVLDETYLIQDEDGKPAFVQGFLLDITERKAAEAARAQFGAIVESSDDAIMGADLDGTITTWNAGAEKTFGWTAEEAVGQPVSILAPPDRAQEPMDFVAAVRDGHGVAHHEVVRQRKDGTLVDVSLTLSPVRDGAGHVVGISAIGRDITERKQAERELERLLVLEREQNERLRELDRLKDEFVALVSHELRTPLTSIRGYLELVLDGEAGELTDEQRQFLTVVERNAHRLLALVGDLLFLAQIEAGKLVLEIGAVDLASVASESVEAARPLAEQRDITLTLAAGPVPLLAGDRARLAQIFDNLVSNALKFTPEGGQVDVRLRGLQGRVAVEIRDTGIGIPANEQQHLFERFFRSSSATERQIQGTGLGLAISKAIVEAHGGHITVASEEGAGTTFRISLPVRQPQTIEAEAEAVAL